MNDGRKSFPGVYFPVPKYRFVIWINIIISLVVSAIGLGLGFSQQWLPAQQVILYTILTAGSLFLLLNYTAKIFQTWLELSKADSDNEREKERRRTSLCLKTEFSFYQVFHC